MKKFLSLVLAFVLLLTCVPAVPAQATETEEIYEEVFLEEPVTEETEPPVTEETEPVVEEVAVSEPVKMAESAVPEGLEYKIVDDQTVTIVKYTGDAEEVIIPETIEGLPVTVIGIHAFASNKTGPVSFN